LPPIPGLANGRALNSESIQELDQLPEHLIVIGGGYIGCEFAQMFRRFGSQVTLIDRNEAFLRREDPDVAAQILQFFQEDGIEVILGASAQQVEWMTDQTVRVRLQSSSGGRTIEGSHLLAAVGR